MTPADPRFVVLRHETPSGYPKPTHYDLMLEAGPVLRTWTVWQWPSIESGGVEIGPLEIEAQADADHRLAYLEYQGEVSGGRGRVTRVAEGTYRILTESADQIHLVLAGESQRGELVLRIQSSSD